MPRLPLAITALGVALLVLSLFTAARAQAACTAQPVETSKGTVCGQLLAVDDATVTAYLGIPYGQDTAGVNRFQPPQPREPWQGVVEAVAPGPACPQTSLEAAEPPSGQSEDCLFLNVWVPPDVDGELAPVLVFVHGGGFLVGTATDTLAADNVDWFNIDGRFLAAEHGLVVVTMSYRLGAFGFLAGVAGLAGNQGLLDQQLALEWIRDNIGAFGGDPENVTLMGESAGATSVSAHVYAMPSSQGLFKRAIMESNPAGMGVQTPSEARAQGERFLIGIGCFFNADRLACLQGKSVAEVQAAQTPNVSLLSLLDRGTFALLAWLPVADGELVTEQPLRAALAGRSEVPVVLGNNDDEAFSFLGSFITPDVNPFVGGAVIDVLFRKVVGDVIQAEYLSGAEDADSALLAGAGDYVFMCPALLAAVNAPVGYHFRFSHPPQYQGSMTGGENCGGKTCHAVELPYVFGSGRFPGGFSEQDRRVSDTFMTLWSDFAHGRMDGAQTRTGEAGQDRSPPPWPAADEAAGTVPTLVIADPPRVEQFDLTRCEQWAEVYGLR